MHQDIMEILSYLRGDMETREKKLFEKRMDKNPDLKEIVEETDLHLGVIHNWEPLPVSQAVTKNIMDEIRLISAESYQAESYQADPDRANNKQTNSKHVNCNKERSRQTNSSKRNSSKRSSSKGSLRQIKISKKSSNKSNSIIKNINSFLDWVNKFTSIRQMVPGLVMASLIFICLVAVPWQNMMDKETGHIVHKGGVKIVQGARLPVATLLLESEELDIPHILEKFADIDIKILHIERYDTGIVIRGKTGTNFNIDKKAWLKKANGIGKLIRYNQGYSDEEDLTVIVIRKR
ncbi:hypothetical protein MTBBW1_450015 [Desulfamplus magnetovallimortis]|uniref:Uncharacterized protein n=1 Tax=Desulfamplus magnetovallimortis TaxID=1246637 RepID=A0A1W1HH90_9BACT|nr:hypothetical protein [Desulfamplus magnetovallimortis]SLM31844.1 hypothetical protein MTBBW1_450015 [Desulfamplus magnetovallimortis]